MADRSEAYRFNSRTPLTVDALNKRFLDVNARVLAIEIARLGEDEAFSVVLDRVLLRSEGVIASLRERLLRISELRWLTAGSATPATLANGAEFFLEISEADRDLFAPAPFAVLTRVSTVEDWAVVRTVTYDPENGRWDVQVESFSGDPGPHSDWQVTAIAGSTLAQLALLEQGQAAAAAATVAGDVVSEKHAEVLSAWADVMAMAGDVGGAAGFNNRIAALEADAWFYH